MSGTNLIRVDVGTDQAVAAEMTERGIDTFTGPVLESVVDQDHVARALKIRRGGRNSVAGVVSRRDDLVDKVELDARAAGAQGCQFGWFHGQHGNATT
ncbi:hypothetical protein C4T70_12530 [Clostridioides difficile]